jgi:hypothetical protein
MNVDCMNELVSEINIKKDVLKEWRSITNLVLTRTDGWSVL